MPNIILPIPDSLPIKIIQQPDGKYDFISNDDNVVTQFSSSKLRNEALGFLAHNTKTGSMFGKLNVGDEISIKGDTPTTRGAYKKQVKNIYKFQALSPSDPKSMFKDLTNNKQYTAKELYEKMYGNKNALVLQTCIEKDGSNNWGRLFVVAE